MLSEVRFTSMCCPQGYGSDRDYATLRILRADSLICLIEMSALS